MADRTHPDRKTGGIPLTRSMLRPFTMSLQSGPQLFPAALLLMKLLQRPSSCWVSYMHLAAPEPQRSQCHYRHPSPGPLHRTTSGFRQDQGPLQNHSRKAFFPTSELPCFTRTSAAVGAESRTRLERSHDKKVATLPAASVDSNSVPSRAASERPWDSSQGSSSDRKSRRLHH